MPKNVYIAETDERGRVVSVWVLMKGKKTPSVFDPKRHSYDDRSEARFSGAEPAAIKDWISGQSRMSGRERHVPFDAQSRLS